MEIGLKNLTPDTLYTPMAIIGIPAGTELQSYQLKELKDNGYFDYYEIQNNYLVLYFTELSPKKHQKIPIRLVATHSGTFQAPASSTYLYYESEHKHWITGPKPQILP